MTKPPLNLAVAALALAALPLSADAGDVVEISQKDRRFAPGALTIRPMQTVRVLNDDRFIHHVYFETARGEFDSGDQRPGETVVLKFPGVGAYEVRCAIHPKMRLKVDVADG
ncbi:MAG: hypothetical protein AAFV51_06055 [Pseudomonadota bacterium]